MDKPRNPFKKWKAVGTDNIKFFLCTFDKKRVHAATNKTSDEGTAIYYISRKFIEDYPMVMQYTGEPSLHSHFRHSVVAKHHWYQFRGFCKHRYAILFCRFSLLHVPIFSAYDGTNFFPLFLTINVKEIADQEVPQIPEGRPWCHVFFCSNREKQVKCSDPYYIFF